MTTRNEQLQRAWREYERANGHLPASARDASMWAVQNGLIPLPEVDPYDVLADAMSRALREEYATDRKGRRYRVNHAVRVTRRGVQYTMWAVMQAAPREHMQKAFTQRREQVVGDLVQLATDVQVYNEMHKDAEPIQLILDFNCDVEERLAA
ncbi:hypothetical protein [Geminicoccus harenae]|uniref:hypothetical protein n=1 Tax=Geminicoccus harenae TaxID=2498453 RepID=UPI00168B67F6|nr:hypothetical protein [Geminicoccus harenae]